MAKEESLFTPEEKVVSEDKLMAAVRKADALLPTLKTTANITYGLYELLVSGVYNNRKVDKENDNNLKDYIRDYAQQDAMLVTLKDKIKLPTSYLNGSYFNLKDNKYFSKRKSGRCLTTKNNTRMQEIKVMKNFSHVMLTKHLNPYTFQNGLVCKRYDFKSIINMFGSLSLLLSNRSKFKSDLEKREAMERCLLAELPVVFLRRPSSLKTVKLDQTSSILRPVIYVANESTRKKHIFTCDLDVTADNLLSYPSYVVIRDENDQHRTGEHFFNEVQEVWFEIIDALFSTGEDVTLCTDQDWSKYMTLEMAQVLKRFLASVFTIELSLSGLMLETSHIISPYAIMALVKEEKDFSLKFNLNDGGSLKLDILKRHYEDVEFKTFFPAISVQAADGKPLEWKVEEGEEEVADEENTSAENNTNTEENNMENINNTLEEAVKNSTRFNTESNDIKVDIQDITSDTQEKLNEMKEKVQETIFGMNEKVKEAVDDILKKPKEAKPAKEEKEKKGSSKLVTGLKVLGGVALAAGALYLGYKAFGRFFGSEEPMIVGEEGIDSFIDW